MKLLRKLPFWIGNGAEMAKLFDACDRQRSFPTTVPEGASQPNRGDFLTNAFSNQWRGLLESLLHRGSAAGADLVEVFLERTDHIGLLAEQDRITSVNPSFARGAGLRVFRGGRDGFVSTNDLSEAGLMRALDQALAMLGLEPQQLTTPAAFEGLKVLTDHGLAKADWLERCPSLDQASQCLLKAHPTSIALVSTFRCARQLRPRLAGSAGGCIGWHLCPRHPSPSVDWPLRACRRWRPSVQHRPPLRQFRPS